MLSITLAGLLASSLAFGQQPGQAAQAATKWFNVAAGFPLAIAAAACGYAQSRVAAAACEGMARNPGSRPGIQFAFILGLVFIETLVLFTFATVFSAGLGLFG